MPPAHTNTDCISSLSYHVPLHKHRPPIPTHFPYTTLFRSTAGNNEANKTSPETTTLEDTVAPSSGATSAQLDNTGTIAVDAHAKDASPSSELGSAHV